MIHVETNETMNGPILFLINKLGSGGAEHVFLEDASELSARGIPVHFGSLYPPEPSPGVAQGTRLRTMTFRFTSLMDIRGFFRLRRYVLERGIRMVYSTLEEANIVARLLKITVPRLKVSIRESNDASRKSWKFKLLDLSLNLCVDAIVAVSAGVKNSLLRYQRVYAGKIVVLENGVRMPGVTVQDSVPEGIGCNILCVGSLTPQKNHAFLIDAFRDVLNNLPVPATLTIIGSGRLRNSIEERIRKTGVDGKVVVAGSVPKREMAQQYAKANLFVLPSLWEGCPNALLEAMSYGLPAIATRVSGSEDIIEEGVSGFLVEPGDIEALQRRMVQLANDPDLRKRIGLAARRRIAERYSFDRHIANLLRIMI